MGGSLFLDARKRFLTYYFTNVLSYNIESVWFEVTSTLVLLRRGYRILPRGGTNPGAKRPRKFPPPEHFRGGQRGTDAQRKKKSKDISKYRHLNTNLEIFPPLFIMTEIQSPSDKLRLSDAVNLPSKNTICQH